MIKWIVIAIIGLIVLGYLGIDIRKAIQSEASQSNLEYAKEVVVYAWNSYLKEPVKFIWSEVFVKYIWDPLINKANNKVKGISANDTGAFFLIKSISKSTSESPFS